MLESGTQIEWIIFVREKMGREMVLYAERPSIANGTYPLPILLTTSCARLTPYAPSDADARFFVLAHQDRPINRAEHL